MSGARTNLVGAPDDWDERAHCPSGNFNAQKCAAYLRWIGVEVSDRMEAEWRAVERDTRARRRAHKRELKQSCGHFRTYWSTVHHYADGTTRVRYCSDCGAAVEWKRA